MSKHSLKRLLLIGVVPLAISCSSEVQVPKNHYGVLVRMGEAVGAESGPTQLNRTVIDRIVIFPKEQELVFSAANGTTFAMILEVVDPKKFYFMTLGHGEKIVTYYAEKLSTLSPDQGATFLMAELNKPESGFRMRLAN